MAAGDTTVGSTPCTRVAGGEFAKRHFPLENLQQIFEKLKQNLARPIL
jgi:hypothetical protein